MLGTSIVYALIVYNKCKPNNKLKITQFRKSLVDEILKLEKPENAIDGEPSTSKSVNRGYEES